MAERTAWKLCSSRLRSRNAVDLDADGNPVRRRHHHPDQPRRVRPRGFSVRQWFLLLHVCPPAQPRRLTAPLFGHGPCAGPLSRRRQGVSTGLAVSARAGARDAIIGSEPGSRQSQEATHAERKNDRGDGPVTDLDRSRLFYGETLGLTSYGRTLRALGTASATTANCPSSSVVVPTPRTRWPTLRSTILRRRLKELESRGVTFLDYSEGRWSRRAISRRSARARCLVHRPGRQHTGLREG